jgi:thiol-disulfide isomerase/thioredoxin
MNRTFNALAALAFLSLLLAACNTRAAGHQTGQVILTSAAVEEGAMSQTKPTVQPVKIDKTQFKRAAEISSPIWINSTNLNWDDLRGKVIVIDFWTFACYNCKNTLPYLKAWDEKYRAQGLVVLGVHTPELSFEKDVANVRQAVRDYNIKYPVAIDGDFANWNRYGVRAWPTWFIVDKAGYIRYSHIGEGAYDKSEQIIRELLAE